MFTITWHALTYLHLLINNNYCYIFSSFFITVLSIDHRPSGTYNYLLTYIFCVLTKKSLLYSFISFTICPKLMRLRVRHVFLTVKTVLVGGGMIEWHNPHKTHLPLSYLSYAHPKINFLVNARPLGPVNTTDLVLLSKQGRPRIECKNHEYNA